MQLTDQVHEIPVQKHNAHGSYLTIKVDLLVKGVQIAMCEQDKAIKMNIVFSMTLSLIISSYQNVMIIFVGVNRPTFSANNKATV